MLTNFKYTCIQNMNENSILTQFISLLKTADTTQLTMKKCYYSMPTLKKTKFINNFVSNPANNLLVSSKHPYLIKLVQNNVN